MKKLLIIIVTLSMLPAAQAQSLNETLNWLQNKMDFYSRYVVIDSAGMLTEVNYRMDFNQDSPCKVMITENAKTIGSAMYQFQLSEMDSANVEIKQITSVYPHIKIHDDVYLLFLHTRNQQEMIYTNYKGAYSGPVYETRVVFGVKTQQMAERVQRGIKHAIQLCQEKDDLFFR